MMKNTLFAAALLAACAVAHAKIPPPVLDDAAKAKAAEAAAKTAWSAKVDGFLLCKSQDKVAAAYAKTAKANGKDVKPAVATPPCADPGPFVFAAAGDPKPLEAAGAHSPATTAASPPSSNKPASVAIPGKK